MGGIKDRHWDTSMLTAVSGQLTATELQPNSAGAVVAAHPREGSSPLSAYTSGKKQESLCSA